MRKIIYILLLIGFAMQATSQLWILAFFKLNQSYIASNICINRFEDIPVCKGSCFLEDQFNKDKQEQEKYPDLKIKLVNLFTTEIKYQDIVSIVPISLKHPLIKSSGEIPTVYLQGIFRPPLCFV